MDALKQLIPSEVCLKCQVCCRFPTPESDMFPVFMKEEASRLSSVHQSLLALKDGVSRPVASPYHGVNGQECACPFFNPVTQACAIYPDRPLDCQLYPFVLIFGQTKKRILLGLDVQCPFVQDASNEEALLGYGEYVRQFLEEKETVEVAARNPGLIGNPGETIFPFSPLAGLTEKFCRSTLFGDLPLPSFGLTSLTLKDRAQFPEEAFVPMIAFQDLLHFYWKKEGKVLLIVALQGNHFFMPIPPVATRLTPELLIKSFDLLDALNEKRAPSRIEGLSEENLPLAKELGCILYPKSPEYLYRRTDLVELAGNAYKSKRSLCNYFVKHYPFTFGPYQRKDFLECLSLFKRWQEKREKKTKDSYELALLEDAAFVHRRILLYAEALGVEGKVVRVGGETKGYTFGYPSGHDTWSVFLEIADPDVKGLAQFLFREFCREKKEFPFISAMDDSDLERLRRVKESYRPSFKKIPYVAARKPI